jgi:hypothetical protein
MPVPEKAQFATSDCAKPDSSVPPAIALTLATDQFDDTADATSPGTPQLPPSSQDREPGGFEMALAKSPPMG